MSWELCGDCGGRGKGCTTCEGAGQVWVEPPWPPYSFTEAVAAEARAASRRYWANNDKRFPVHADVDKHWPLNEPPPPPAATTRRGLSR